MLKIKVTNKKICMYFKQNNTLNQHRDDVQQAYICKIMHASKTATCNHHQAFSVSY